MKTDQTKGESSASPDDIDQDPREAAAMERLIILAVVFVLGAIGAFVYNHNQGSKGETATETAKSSVSCNSACQVIEAKAKRCQVIKVVRKAQLSGDDSYREGSSTTTFFCADLAKDKKTNQRLQE